MALPSFLEEIQMKWRATVFHQQDTSHIVEKCIYADLSSCVEKYAVWIQ
jgi:hypothetical protein